MRLMIQPQTNHEPNDRRCPDIVIGRRIIICCDGTWQSSVSSAINIPSNVTRLARSFAQTDEDETSGIVWQQLVYYSSGVGTDKSINFLERVRQATFGDGLDAEIFRAYNFIVNNYALGDKIYCFGFSRGAFTARSVAGLVTDIGIIRPAEMCDFPALWKIYQDHDSSHTFRKSAQYRQWITGVRDGKGHWAHWPHTLPPESTRHVHVVGVFDTVGALGIPGFGLFESIDTLGIPATKWAKPALNLVIQYLSFSGLDKIGFHNTSLSPYIEHAYHALSLDEHRKPFTPTLWKLPKKEHILPKRPQCQCCDNPELNVRQRMNDLAEASDKDRYTLEKRLSKAWEHMIDFATYDEPREEPELKQVWFPGTHTNIGGGNPGILHGLPYDYEREPLIIFFGP
ncbi:hypothetical protein LX32DRAFT_700288 [Colletotrichum zoysiae]|uniref:T6SS Phospholipase effector Tle1-like catalytic domain-containing protein n=1 Tax=Colletotrichum zoysiae TaxID=1216348 RepID=A0AAD9M9N7_9PEZI|nr:hypothetical protein LX32DRAFT_700288 [Colletotrichum zoysiae]